MGKSKAPRPPNPYETAKAQTASNVDTAIANNTMQLHDQHTPYGSLTYDVTRTTNVGGKDVPSYASTVTLSPGEQYKLEKGTEAEKNLADLAVERTDFLKDHFTGGIQGDSLTPREDIPQTAELDRIGRTNYSRDRQRVEDALMERMQPQIDRDREALQDRLVNQGITLGSEAYSSAQDDLQRGINDARLGAILGAGQEQNRMAELEAMKAGFNNTASTQEFGMDADRFNMANALRQSDLSEQFALRNQPINEITALLSGSQVSMPNVATQTPQAMPNTDVAGLINSNYNQQLAGWQQRQQSRNSLLGGLFGLGGDAILGGMFG